MRRVRKSFSGLETPLFEGMLAARQPAEEEDAIPSPPSHDIPSPSQEPSSPPQQPPKARDYQAACKGKEGRMIEDMDKDEGIELVKDADIAESEAEIYNLDLDHSSKVLSMQKDDSEV
nr:hypothetical protein [Tanacetum cinerariifolium]